MEWKAIGGDTDYLPRTHLALDESELSFAGESAEEAEDFIRAVNKRAWAAGKQNDPAWMAGFAYTCFARMALRWYEELDEQTQTDWKLLKRAILTTYARPQRSGSIVPSNAPASAR